MLVATTQFSWFRLSDISRILYPRSPAQYRLMKFLFNLPLSNFRQRIVVPFALIGKLVKHLHHLKRSNGTICFLGDTAFYKTVNRSRLINVEVIAVFLSIKLVVLGRSPQGLCLIPLAKLLYMQHLLRFRIFSFCESNRPPNISQIFVYILYDSRCNQFYCKIFQIVLVI